ncbi:MAG: hypothetical protein ACRDAX_00690 [Propionibacteriaceae bacterium]
MAKKERFSSIKIMVLLLLSIVLIAVGVLWGWHSYTDSPERARASYAHALASGDSRALRRLTLEPAIDLVTTDASLALMASRNEAVAEVAITDNGIRFSLAGETHDIALETIHVGNIWKIKTPTASLSLQGFPGIVAVDGVTVTDRENVMLIPGIHELTSADSRLAWDPVKVKVVDPLMSLMVVPPQARITESGMVAARKAAQESLHSCLAAKDELAKDCLQPSDPPAMVFDKTTIELALAEESSIGSMNFSLEEGGAWGWSDPVQLPLRIKGNVIRRNDLTQGVYQQNIVVSARVRVEFLPDGKTVALWCSV